ncbi:MAG: hypothetical protein LBT50_01725 [Prevotellaceae bacterium]|jgi:hypothetical protein|nr:hypothetical protein [Prevotellaceae bacterium]
MKNTEHKTAVPFSLVDRMLGIEFLFGLLILFCSCDRTPEEPPLKTRTVIVYMVADNSLNTEVEPDINEMERGWNSYDGNLIVYVDQKRVAPYVLEIRNDRSNAVVSTKVLQYEEQNSCSVDVMAKVLADIKETYPAKSYGLILWSHASGWLPSANAPLTRVFGEDGSENMEITELAKLPGKYDFFIFDACNMIGIESVFELRHNADFIVGSAAEILVGGFPYNEILEFLFKGNADLVSVSQKFMSYYRSFSDKVMQSAVLSVIKTDSLDKLAAISRRLIQNHKDNIASVNLLNIQKYDSHTTTLFHDFQDFMESISGSDSDLEIFRNLLQSTVIFKDFTPTMLNVFDIKRSSGLNCYIPGRVASFDVAYKNMAWYKATY